MTDIPTALEDAQAHLAAALLQTVPVDDETIMGHVRSAHAILRDVRRQLSNPPRFVPGSKGPWGRPSSHRQAEGLSAEHVLPLATLAALNGDDTPPEAA